MNSLPSIILSLLDIEHQLFFIKPVCHIIASYAISFPSTLYSEYDLPSIPNHIKSWIPKNSQNQYCVVAMFDSLQIFEIDSEGELVLVKPPWDPEIYKGFDVCEGELFLITQNGDLFSLQSPLEEQPLKQMRLDDYKSERRVMMAIDKKRHCLYYQEEHQIISLWNLKSSLRAGHIVVENVNNFCVCSSLNLIALHSFHECVVFNLPHFERKLTIKTREINIYINCICFAPDFNCIVIGFENSMINFHSLDTGECVHQIRTCEAQCMSMVSGFLVVAENNLFERR